MGWCHPNYYLEKLTMSFETGNRVVLKGDFDPWIVLNPDIDGLVRCRRISSGEIQLYAPEVWELEPPPTPRVLFGRVKVIEEDERRFDSFSGRR
jgi:hypothetical protein